MATKAEIQNLINTNLSSGSGIEATDHRAVLNEVLDNLYGIVTTDNSNPSSPSKTGIVSQANSNQNFGLDITKNGNRVNISGSIRNDTGSILSANSTFLTINQSEYLMQTSSGDSAIYSVGCKGFDLSGANDDITITLSSNVLVIKNPMPIGSIYKFSITYNTAN